MPPVPEGPGELLLEHDADIQLAGQASGRGDVWRLFRQYRGGRTLRAARACESRSGGDGAAALRGDHDLFTDAPLGHYEGEEGRRGGSRRLGPYGGEVR